MRLSEVLPWGMTKVTGRLPLTPPVYERAEIDPVSQTTRYYDEGAVLVDFGRHGTNVSSSTTSVSGGGDGSKPQPQTADDSNTDYSSD